MILCLFFAVCWSYNIDPAEISVAGLSAGAYFASQFQIAYSSIIKGSGVSAGGPYYCAQNSVYYALGQCMEFCYLIEVDQLVNYAKKFEELGMIDSLDNLKNQRTYLYSGLLDQAVNQLCMRKLFDMLGDLGMKNVTTEFGILSNHAFITTDYGNECAYFGSPYINNCDYDEAYAILNKIYDLQNEKVAPIRENIKEFDQTKYKAESWDDYGYAYVPTTCQNNNSCRLIVVFHGCEQQYAAVGEIFILNSGFNRWAESNNVVIVYPQTVIEKYKNPKACFDWWGYSGSDYAFKCGNQMVATKSIIDDFSNPSFLL